MSESAISREGWLLEFMDDGDQYSWVEIVSGLAVECHNCDNGYHEWFGSLLDLLADGTVKQWGGTFDATYEVAGVINLDK